MAARKGKSKGGRAKRQPQATAGDSRALTLHSLVFVALLGGSVFTGLTIVAHTEDVRQLYQRLADLQHQQDSLLEERSRLLLERGATTQLQNIEGIASDELGMVFPEELGGVIE